MKKTQKLWGIFNHDVLWEVGKNRRDLKFSCAVLLKSSRQSLTSAQEEVEEWLKKGNFVIRRISVSYEE